MKAITYNVIPTEQIIPIEQIILTEKTSSKYPMGSRVTKLSSTLEIKQRWLHSEWDPKCQFSKYIQPSFLNQNDLNPENQKPDVKLIESVFDIVRGKYILWQSPRENASWKKVVVELSIDWVLENVEVLYPSKEQFEVAELNGIVLWDDQSGSKKRYKLYEGNHRISTWLFSQTPETLPATIFIGR